MTYAYLQSGTVIEYPVYAGDIQLRFPNTSFSIPFEPPSDYVFVAGIPQPSCNYTQNIAEGTPELIEGTWTQVWNIVDATTKQITERTDAKKQEIRANRNRRLTECDWTQLSDAPVNAAEWATYRQELRDLTTQAGFPWNIDWPEAP
jgi:hypothetical protein